MFLQETYMSTLEISDEYTLDLAKCIYEYLRDFYPNKYKYYISVQSLPEDFDSLMAEQSQYKYLKKQYINGNWTGGYIYAGSGSVWADNTYFIEGYNLDISQIYIMGMQTAILGDGTRIYNDYFPGVSTYKFLGYSKDISKPEDVLNVEDHHKIYSLDGTVQFIDILENPKLAELLKQKTTEDDLRVTGKGEMLDRDYRRLLKHIDELEQQRANFSEVPSANATDSDLLNFVSDGFLAINKYNISSWPINESILQYLTPELVITKDSFEDDIAQMQLLAQAEGYNDYTPGIFDNKLENLCVKSQEFLMERDQRVVPTGYCDIYVEYKLRAANEERVEVY